MSAADDILWHDLTVPNADLVRDFYAAVAGWRPEPVPMGDYADYSMASPASGEPVAGVCHKRGANEGMPSVWMVYFRVADLAAAASTCEESGGKLLVGPKEMGGHGRYAVIEDPAGAVCALFEPAA